MRVTRVSSTEQWLSVAPSWNLLSHGVPFHSWEWLSAWWRHYGAGHELAVLLVFDDHGNLVGAAPWYLEQLGSRGRVLRTLGSGEVCSDYPSILCTVEFQAGVTAALAEWLTAHSESLDWDLLELECLPATESAGGRLIEELSLAGCSTLTMAGPNLWRIPLPEDWDEYLSRLSKSHRKQIKRLLRDYESAGRTQVWSTQDRASPEEAMRILIELHQRRWQAVGRAGAFASARFMAFLQEVTSRLQERDGVQITVLEIDGRPAAADYLLLNSTTVFAYQGGMEPALVDTSPGKLLTSTLIRNAIRAGRKTFDFLRGDEAYKPHFRAEPIPSRMVHIVRRRTASQIRHGLWMTGIAMKNLVKSGLSFTGMDPSVTSPTFGFRSVGQ